MAALEDVDLTLELSAKKGKAQLKKAQKRLLALRLQCGGQIGGGTLGPPLLILFEGWDAGGKGGAIRRLTAPLDPRHYTVAQFSAPTPREKRHHFLWRFWPYVPGVGGMVIFDRTYYGRVLVERVEGFATEQEWQRAYDEIVGFERGLVDEGVIVLKFWMQISPEEQLRRFEARKDDPLKQWKLTDEDWRNREKRPAYEQALKEMLKRTDHKHSHWTVVAAENKRYARVAVLNRVIEELEKAMRARGIEPVTDEFEL
jgi:AMP-polyphosphate phosphotransferase